jgi:hypothetical protein
MPGVHPPPFRLGHRLSDWPACGLELHCCKGVVIWPVRLLATKHGDLTFGQVIARLRCERCGGRPAQVYLCAGHRVHVSGAAADWAIELVPTPRTS